MTRPDPFDIDDEDPFADSFASFDEPEAAPAPEPEAVRHDADAPAAAEEPEVASAAALAGEVQAFEADPAGDAPLAMPGEAHASPAEPADHAPLAGDTDALLADGRAPVSAQDQEAPFDWFADFPKTQGAVAAAEARSATGEGEPQAVAKPKGRGWLSGLAKRAVVSEPTPEPHVEEAAHVAAAPEESATAADVDAFELEALAEAPSVPAAFDDALTEAQPFELISAPAPDALDEVFTRGEADAPPSPGPIAEVIASAEAAMGEAVVPRIAIHVFAQKAETAAVAQTAATDRRLQRASTAVRPGGLPEALALYASSPTPALVIVENTAPASQLLADLDRLAEVCDPGTKVVVIGEANDIGLYRELIRRGVSEYLVPPLSALQLIRTIGGLYADPEAPFVGRTIAFVGAKGGVGASTMAHNFAWCLSERIEAQACVVDYDLAFGTAGLDFNQDPVQGFYDALSKPDRLDATLIERMLARCTERLSLFAAPATLDDDYDISADAYEEVAGKIRSTAPFMVLDLPHVWSGWMRKTLLSADEVVLVAQPDLASLRNAKNMVELITKARPNDAPPRLVLNQVGLPGRPEIPLKEFSKALGLEPSMIVPFDAKLFGQASNNGQMIGEVNAKSKASEALMQFAQAVTRREAVAAKPKSLVERLLKGG